MKFDEAFKHLKEGHKIRRDSWPAEDYFLNLYSVCSHGGCDEDNIFTVEDIDAIDWSVKKMIVYKDTTYCASPNCKNKCNRQMTKTEKDDCRRLNSYVSYGYFCGSPRDEKE